MRVTGAERSDAAKQATTVGGTGMARTAKDVHRERAERGRLLRAGGIVHGEFQSMLDTAKGAGARSRCPGASIERVEAGVGGGIPYRSGALRATDVLATKY